LVLPSNPFVDVRKDDWFYEDVVYVYGRNLFYGVNENSFGPHVTMSRAMVVTVLGRHYGIDTSAYTSTGFIDVNSNAYYAPYVEWARQAGIVDGDVFRPEEPITRQDLAVMLVRYANYAVIGQPVVRQYTGFADSASIADYAREAVESLYTIGVINGSGDSFNPTATATRAEVAAMLRRLLQVK
jgi:hypothetical protein